MPKIKNRGHVHFPVGRTVSLRSRLGCSNWRAQSLKINESLTGKSKQTRLMPSQPYNEEVGSIDKYRCPTMCIQRGSERMSGNEEWRKLTNRHIQLLRFFNSLGDRYGFFSRLSVRRGCCFRVLCCLDWQKHTRDKNMILGCDRNCDRGRGRWVCLWAHSPVCNCMRNCTCTMHASPVSCFHSHSCAMKHTSLERR